MIMPYAIALLILMAPLPFGGSFPWFTDACGLVVGLALFVTSMSPHGLPMRRSMPFTMVAAGMLVLATVIWTMLQLYGETQEPHIAWQLAKEYGLQAPETFSLAPTATLSALIRLMSYIGFFWIAWINAQSRQQATRLLLLLFIIEIIYALYGLIRFLGDFQTILWIHVGGANGLSSTFINRNTYATFANLGVIIGIGLILERIRLQRALLSRTGKNLRHVVEIIIEPHIYYWLGLSLVMAATLLTSSRGGLVSLLIGILILLMSSYRSPVLSRYGRAAIPILVGLLILMPFIGDTAAERLDQSLLEDLRWLMWRQTIEGIAHTPLFGTGLGTFEQAYPLYASIEVPFFVDKAHNTFLEHALELGLPVASIFYVAFFILFLICWRQGHRPIPAIGAASTVMVGTHALLDFSLQLPAVALLFSTILGTASGRACRVPKSLCEPLSSSKPFVNFKKKHH